MLEALAREPDPHTSVSDPEQAVDIHVADSLSGLEVPEVRAASWIADVGSGAGFPGLVLAVALARARVDMIESASKKCAVIDRLANAAGLDNELARALPMRAEERAAWGGGDSYDVVTARAVAALPVLVEYAAPLLTMGGVFVAWKGSRDADDEARGSKAAVEVGLESEAVVEVQPWPGVRDRNLHVYRKVSPTPERYPRRPGMAVKRP
ncbi:MAG: rRNA (guanine527-N7)-methyltransferase, partial [Thermoleophilaceae bacterium]|nr:rRNA (guanine527-N7)-methyltransferase [Thermoleophilaceae bacterium]